MQHHVPGHCGAEERRPRLRTAARRQVLRGLLVATGLGAASLPASGGVGTADRGRHLRGIRANTPWLSFYGSAQQAGDLNRLAATFRLINIDADPDSGNFTPAQIRTLKAGGRNTVLSYLNLGSCERSRRYFRQAPAGLVPCGRNRAAQLGPYPGYPDEVWMNPANADLPALDPGARRAAAGGDGRRRVLPGQPRDRGARGPRPRNRRPCDRDCVAGALTLVARLRRAFPDLALVMQNATGPTTRDAIVDGVPFPRLIDGISREEVYAPRYDRDAEAELLAWRQLGLSAGGSPVLDHDPRLRRQLPRPAPGPRRVRTQPRQRVLAVRDNLQRQPGPGL